MTENSRTYALVNLGCKVNRVESDGFEAQLRQAGFQPVEESADLVVVNTCTVTGEAEKKTRKAVRQALKTSSAKSRNGRLPCPPFRFFCSSS